MTPLKIDIPATLRAKAPDMYVPPFVVHWLERIAHVKQMNRFLEEHPEERDFEFARVLLEDELHCTFSTQGTENIPQTEQLLLFAGNHPLGGLDGIILALLLGQQRNYKIRLIVNDLLMNVKPLAGLFVPVNKVGRQNREYAKRQEEVWQSDNDILTFPAGACSRLQHIKGEGWVIRDLTWQKSFIRHAVQYRRDIIPVYFDGQNSSFFYRLALWRKRLGIRTNIEMLYLADEMYKASGKHFAVRIGKPVPYTVFDYSRTQLEWAQYVKDIVYNL
jgi:putative hemolysin